MDESRVEHQEPRRSAPRRQHRQRRKDDERQRVLPATRLPGSGAGDFACHRLAGDSPAVPKRDPLTSFHQNRPAKIAPRRLLTSARGFQSASSAGAMPPGSDPSVARVQSPFAQWQIRDQSQPGSPPKMSRQFNDRGGAAEHSALGGHHAHLAEQFLAAFQPRSCPLGLQRRQPELPPGQRALPSPRQRNAEPALGIVKDPAAACFIR